MAEPLRVSDLAGVEQALQCLIGLPLSIVKRHEQPPPHGYFVQERLQYKPSWYEFHFGAIQRPNEQTAFGQFVITAHCPWRIETADGLLTGQADYQRWRYELPQPEGWHDHRHGSLQEALLHQLLGKTADEGHGVFSDEHGRFVVEQINLAPTGDVKLSLSRGYHLALFPTSLSIEAWCLSEANATAPLITVGDAATPRGFAPKTASDYLARAEIRQWSSDTPGAVDDCTEAIRLEPNNSEAYSKRGYYRDDISSFGEDAYKSALVDYARAIELDPHNSEAYHGRYMIFEWDVEDRMAAIHELTRAIEIDPEDNVAYDSRAFQYWRLDENEKALADATRAIEIYADSSEYYIRRSKIYADLENYEAAIADLTTALRVDPDATYIYKWRGDAKYNSGDVEGSLADYTLAITRTGKFGAGAEDYHARAWFYLNENQPDKALEDANKAVEHSTDEWDIFHTRGLIHAELGHVARAIADFTRALDLEPDEEESIAMRGYIDAHIRPE